MCAESTELALREPEGPPSWRQLRVLSRGGCLRLVGPGEAAPLTKDEVWRAVARLLAVRPDLRWVPPVRVSDDEVATRIVGYVGEHPGASWSETRVAVGVATRDSARVRDRLLADGVLVSRARRAGWFSLWLAADWEART